MPTSNDKPDLKTVYSAIKNSFNGYNLDANQQWRHYKEAVAKSFLNDGYYLKSAEDQENFFEQKFEEFNNLRASGKLPKQGIEAHEYTDYLGLDL